MCCKFKSHLLISEPICESLLQYHILLYILYVENGLSGWSGFLYNGAKEIRKYAKDPLYVVTTATSFLSAAFGMAKFLKTGPCQLISNDGLLGGYFQLGFILNFIYILLVVILRSTLSLITLVFGNIYLAVASFGITFIYVSTYSLNSHK